MNSEITLTDSPIRTGSALDWFISGQANRPQPCYQGCDRSAIPEMNSEITLTDWPIRTGSALDWFISGQANRPQPCYQGCDRSAIPEMNSEITLTQSPIRTGSALDWFISGQANRPQPCYQIWCQLVFDRQSIGIILDFNWHQIGCRLAFYWGFNWH